VNGSLSGRIEAEKGREAFQRRIILGKIMLTMLIGKTKTPNDFQDHVINARKVFLFTEKMGFELGDSGKNELKIGSMIYCLLSQFDQRHFRLQKKLHFNDYSKVIEYRKRKAIETKGKR